MDYDDDDIPRHNLQLASEGRSKSSSALRPYDFPDFDFDNNLQGHLRFDSLVETEVFLGIQSQEDDKWIEDYSQVSNGMEFNSTPANSRSTRRNNVWSEATSSESVEMLLKSVGQEVMLPAASNIPGTNTCDDQGASATHVEPGSDLDIRKSETSQDEVHIDPSENRHMEEQLPRVEVSLLSSEDAGLSCEHVQNLVQETVCASSGIPANEEPDTETTEENLLHPETFICSQVTVLSTPEASLQRDANVSHVSCNESEHETHPSSGTTLEATMNLKGTTEKDSFNISTLSDIPCLVPETRVLNSADSNKESPDGAHLKASKDSSSEKDIELVFPRGDEKNVSLESSAQTDTSDDKSLATNRASEIPLGGCQEGPSSDGNNQLSTELGSLAEHCTSFDQTTDTSMQLIPEQDWISEDAQTSESQNKILSETALLEVEDTKVSIEMADWIVNTDIGKPRNTDLPSSETSLVTVEVNNVTMEKDGGHENTEMGKSNNKGLLSSDVEEHQTGNIDGYANDSTFVQEGLGAHLVADVTGDSGKLIVENIGHALAEFSATGEAISEISHMDEKNSVSPRNMEFETVETPTVQLAIQPVGEDEAVQGSDSIHGLQNQTSGRREADELALHTKSTDMDAVADHLENGQGKISVTGFPVSDNNPEVVDVTKTSDAHLRSEADKISEVEATSDSTPFSLSEGAAASLQSVKKVDGMCSNKSLSPKAINSLDLDNSNVDMVKSNVQIGGRDNHEVTIIKPGGSQESPQAADVDKASCGSPTIISSSEAPPTETNAVEEARGSEVTENVVKISTPTSEDLKVKESVGDDTTFTFKVSAMPDTTQESGKSWSPILDADKSNSLIVTKESTLTSKMKTAKLPSPKTPRQSVQIADVQLLQGSSKSTYERKGKRASGKGAGKESAKKGSQAKGPNQENSAGVVDKGPTSSPSTPTSSPFVQFPHLQSYGKVEESSKLSHTGVLTTSNHADLSALSLNKSTSMSPISRQPFTDLQQVQLRAQIFVYGSLIQGTAPDEACMISAFGPSDTERISWDPVWRIAVERVRTQKSSSSITATPLPSHSGARVSDLAVKHNLHSSKLPATPSNKVSSKDTPATVASPMIPLSSPLWSISTPLHDSLPSNTMHKGPVVDFQQTVTPMHSYQTPPMGSFNGHTPWQSQPSFRGPWLAPSQTAAFSPSVRFQPVTMTETVKLTPVKDKSLPLASGVKHMTSTSTTHSVGPSPAYVVSPPHDSKTIPPPTELHSGDLKPRKRKKTPVSDHVHSASVSEPQTLPVVIHSTGSLQSLPGGVSPPLNTKMIPPPPEVHSSDLKPKKRKKTSVSDLVHSGPAFEPQTVPVVIHGMDGLHSLPLSVQAPTPVAAMDSCVAVDSTKAVACSEETLKSVAEAKIHAENAAALADNAVGHCEDLWSKLPKQDSGLTSEDEKKLISAAAAIAAAVSVAKAAAAAANVAYNAALQAKLFADETFHSSNPDVVVSSSGKSTTDVQVVGNATPSGLKGEKSSIESTSILVAAKEASKRRVEAASAASKQAENLDAIVKAAELAASAVSQAGKIVAMGDPLCLVDLIEAGPDGYWKLPHTPAEFVGKLRAENKEQSVAIDLKEVESHAMASGEDSVAKRGSRKRSFGKTHQKENLKDILDPQRGASDGIMGSMDTDEKKPRSGRGRKRFIRETSEPESALSLKHSVDAQMNFIDDLTGSLDTDEKKSESNRDAEKSTGVESEDALRTSGSQDEHANLVGALFNESIKEGSSVEVFKSGGSLKTAWYSAIVLELNDRKAYVCYNDLSSDKGSGSFCEWVRLDGEGEKAPIIRVAQPVNALQYQGTRKRRRAALGDYAWGVGDKVDVWIDDCWWEGVVTEKNEKDETTLKVHFPAQVETSTVKAWNLRTSRSWIDGKWEECSSSWKAHHPSDQTDTPQEKRRKMGNPIVATPGKDKLYNEGKLAVGNAVESQHLPLATSERTFNVGKSTKEDGKVVGRRPLRTGPQKEGSRVVFGVPKPTGKMRKFMDVSKHFPASKGDKSKEIYDPSKYAKLPMSQATGSQGWKVPSRNFSRDKRIVESKSKIPGTRKSHRTLPQRDNFSSRSGDVDSGTDNGTDVEDSNGREVSSSVKTTGRGFGVTDEPAEAPLSSLLSNTFSAASKRVPISNSRPGRLNRGKLAPSGGKLSKIEEDKATGSSKFVDEATEPRRSNRRFQPTHRLLEGLQSSMVIPKMPSVTHVKAQRNPSRSVLTRGK